MAKNLGVLSTAALAQRWGIGISALAMQRAQGRGPAWKKIGARIFYEMADVLEYEEARPAAPHEELQPHPATIDRYAKVDEVAAILGVSKPTVYRLIRRSGFPRGIPLSEKAVRWSLQSVHAWVAAKAAGQAA